MSWRCFKRVFWIIPLGFLMLWIAYWCSNFISDNFHTVIKKKLYRSAAMDPLILSRTVQVYHIRTVIDLQGDSQKSLIESQTVKALGVQYDHIPLSAHALPSRDKLQQLAKLLQQAPQPILVHCRQGADRSGLASAMGVILFDDGNFPYVKQQVSWYYNVLSPSSVGYQMLRNYLAWLQKNHYALSKRSFLQWLSVDKPLQVYRGFIFS